MIFCISQSVFVDHQMMVFLFSPILLLCLQIPCSLVSHTVFLSSDPTILPCFLICVLYYYNSYWWLKLTYEKISLHFFLLTFILFIIAIVLFLSSDNPALPIKSNSFSKVMSLNLKLNRSFRWVILGRPRLALRSTKNTILL